MALKGVAIGLLVCFASASAASGNMNGEYIIANADTSEGVTWSSDYTTRPNAEYFDVYSPLISTVYAEVYWTMMDTVPLPADIVSRFANKTIAIVGYEVDQVMQTAQGDVSVPIYWAYNHHYEAFMSGSQAAMEFVDSDAHFGYNHGMRGHWQINQPAAGNTPAGIPWAQFFSEGNGGEFRKSFHGYPEGYAQLLHSPTNFSLQPMQIDTKNRDYDGPGFKAGIEPKEATALPGATYSGLLECPCTTRITKQWSTVYAPISTGTCTTPIKNDTECFDAAATIGRTPSKNATISSSTSPSGCYVINDDAGNVQAVFNTATNSTVQCGGDATVYSGAASSILNVSLVLDSNVPGGEATITLSANVGNPPVWFGIGWNAGAMADLPWAIIIDGTGAVTERKLGDHAPGTQITSQCKVVNSTLVNGIRTVVLTRAFAGIDANHFTFDITKPEIPFINAIGSSGTFGYHLDKAASSLSLTAENGATCVCNNGIKATVNGLPFEKQCAPEPTGDLLQQHNPTCTIQSYAGGLFCCHHENILLDADQPVDNRTQDYNLKFRFWFEEYTPATPTAPASHVNLNRYYFQTEAWAGEYDVVQCPPDTPADQCVQEITARWQVKDMIDCTPSWSPNCTGAGLGIELIYAGGHCHAPSCISMELFNADTGELLCRQVPVFGEGDDIFDEAGYIAIPPCLWGSPKEGLMAPVFLSMDTNLTSVKLNNNTIGHYGEMASWQMRGHPV